MKKLTSYKTETFSYKKDYRIDVVTMKDMYEAWIYRKDYGTKNLMFGVYKRNETYEGFLDLVEANADDYVTIYNDEMQTIEDALNERLFAEARTEAGV